MSDSKIKQLLKDTAPSKPVNILEQAQDIIYNDREQTYGHPSRNLQLIAHYWSGHLGTDITIDDVCTMMMLLKLARLKNTPSHRDTQVDVCGYAALMERCQELAYPGEENKITEH